MKLFKDKKVTIMGLGLHGGGVGVTIFFCKQGAKVIVTDIKSAKYLQESIQKLKGFNVKYILGNHRIKDFIDTDLIIKNPAVPKNSPYLKFATQYGIPIETDISIFFKLSKAPIIGITGTKGKSTVATLLYLLLKSKYPDTILAGNIGISPLEYLSKITKKSKVVLELSSFSLEDLKKSPKISVITTIFPDHLNRYKSFKDYVATKQIIFEYQKKTDILILNHDNLQTRKFSSVALSQVYFYSNRILPKKIKLNSFACFVKNNKIFFDKEKNSIYDIKDLKLKGKDNLSNILAALSVAKILKVPSKNIHKVLEDFKGISWRQELIRTIKEIRYFNDTTATTPQSTITAIRTITQRFRNSKVILIAGGQNKNLDYKSLAKTIKTKVDSLILLPGTASKKIKKELRALKSQVKIYPVNSMKMAVNKASRKAEEKDIVLLSPGAASFNLFKNEFDRGEQFNEEVKKTT